MSPKLIIWLSIIIAILAIAILFMVFLNKSEKEFRLRVSEEFLRNTTPKNEILTEEDIVILPELVKKYLRYVGAIGKSKVYNFVMDFDADMMKKSSNKPMKSSSRQYNFFANSSRFFFMKSSIMGVPARILHQYQSGKASMLVKVAAFFTAVNISGKELSKAETVTILNDMCCFAPATLIDRRLSWQEIDSANVQVFFANESYKVSAILTFNDKGELINFISKDRAALQDDGTLSLAPWKTPIKNYIEIENRKIPSYGEAVYCYPDGDFVYGRFQLKDIKYNVNSYIE